MGTQKETKTPHTKNPFLSEFSDSEEQLSQQDIKL